MSFLNPISKPIFLAEVLKEMIAECKAGCSVRDLCILGDKKLTEETAKAYKKDKKIVKGEFRNKYSEI